MDESIAERIKVLREERGWSKLELARRFGGKNPRTIIYLYESGKRIPGPESLTRLAAIFGCDPFAIDPAGAAAKRKGRRTESGIEKSRTGADSPSVPSEEQAGALMKGGGLPPLPDPKLFGQVIGVWWLLQTSEERRAFIEHVRNYLGIAPARPAALRKKARR